MGNAGFSGVCSSITSWYPGNEHGNNNIGVSICNAEQTADNSYSASASAAALELQITNILILW
jgi:hypothetical protein